MLFMDCKDIWSKKRYFGSLQIGKQWLKRRGLLPLLIGLVKVKPSLSRMKWGILAYGLQQTMMRFQSYLIVVCVILQCEMRQMRSYDDDIWMKK